MLSTSEFAQRWLKNPFEKGTFLYTEHLQQKYRMNRIVWAPWWNRRVFLLGVIILIMRYPFIDLRRCFQILRIAMRSNREELYFKQTEVCHAKSEEFHRDCSPYFVMHWHLCLEWNMSLICHPAVHSLAEGIWKAFCLMSPLAAMKPSH